MAVTTVELPTLYEYYIGNGIKAGLSDAQPYFTLNNKNITLYSGAFHYFRVPRASWRNRLRKMRYAGLNTVETYVPWNLHEPEQGKFDFGSGGSDFEDFLHLEEFLKTAQEEDLFALVRVGPYINSEFEFGGLPSWITKKVKKIRSSADQYFLSFVKAYFNVLIPILAALQFQKGGPVIGFQIENEFGSRHINDLAYLNALKDMLINHGILELLYTSDPPRNGKYGAIPGVLQTINFNGDPKEMFDLLNTFQHGKPNMAMESYTGWFDHWGERHQHKSPEQYKEQLEKILDYPASVNMYMFVGGTSFGFTNGATLTSKTNNSGLLPDTTSYDYDAPIMENGAINHKYDLIMDVIKAHNKMKTKSPIFPGPVIQVKYAPETPLAQIVLSDVISQVGITVRSKNVVTMEELDINNGNGQSYGYIVYKKSNLDIPANAVLKLADYIRDTMLVLINGQLVSPIPRNITDLNGFGFWKQHGPTLVLTKENLKNATLELVVENFGRNTFGAYQNKGITGYVYINNRRITDWKIIPLEFKKSFNLNLKNWQPVSKQKNAPALYKFNLLAMSPSNTFLDMREWTKGIVIVNGFVLGRYFFAGPQQTLFVPEPILKSGNNTIIVFEHYKAPESLKFAFEPIWNVPSSIN